MRNSIQWIKLNANKVVGICTNQQPPQRDGAVPDPVRVGSKWLLAFPRVSVTQGTLLARTIFLPCCSLNDRRRTARSLFAINRLFSPF